MVKEKNIEVLRSKFLRAYAAVPLNMRDEIVAVIGDEPFTWSAAHIEIKGQTKKGDEILRHIDSLNLLGD